MLARNVLITASEDNEFFLSGTILEKKIEKVQSKKSILDIDDQGLTYLLRL